MKDWNPSKDALDAFRRFLKHFPHDKDQTLVILKGHLLIEELVRQIIDERVKNPKALSDCRLDCHDAICLAEALVGNEADEELWRCLKKLNGIRNKFAHNVEPVGVRDKIADFLDSSPLDWNDDNERLQLEFALWSLFAWTLKLVDKPSAEVLQLVANEADT